MVNLEGQWLDFLDRDVGIGESVRLGSVEDRDKD